MDEKKDLPDKIKSKSSLILIFLDIFFLVIGIILIAFPDNTMNITVIVLGIAFIVYSGISIAVYIMKKEKNDITVLNYLFSAAAAVVGIILLVFSPQATVFLPIVTGIWYVICAMYYFGSVFHKIGTSAKFIRSLSLVSVASGIILIIIGASNNGAKYGMFIGVLFIIYTVLNIMIIFTEYCLKKKNSNDLQNKEEVIYENRN